MGIPLYKPKESSKDENRAKSLHQPPPEREEEDFWLLSPVQINQTVNNSNSRRSPNNRRFTITNYHVAPISSSSAFTHRNNNNANHTTNRIRTRISRRHNLLTSPLMDRRRSSRVHSIHDTSPSSLTTPTSLSSLVASPSIRNELDRRLQSRITEKEELLDQLRVTVSLLDQFISARAALGSDMLTLPSLITEGNYYV